MAISDRDVLNAKIDIWKKIIDVQMHFNELEMKVRNFALLIVSAFIGGVGFSLKDDLRVTHWNVPLASIFLFAAAFVCVVFYFVDRFWYHPLLKGAVNQGVLVESSIIASGFAEVALTSAIGKASGIKLPLIKKELHSSKKILILYLSMALLFVVLAVAMLFFRPKADSDATHRTRVWSGLSGKGGDEGRRSLEAALSKKATRTPAL